MSDLLDKIYLPELKKKNLINSNAYRNLEENKQDPSILEGYEHEPDIKSFISNAKNKTDEEWSKELIDPKTQGEAIADIGGFIYDTIKDTGVSLGIAAVNGADVATNLMPLIFKIMSTSPIAVGMPKEFFNPKTEEEVYNTAKYISNNLDKAREYLYSFQDDHGVVEDLIGLITQDLAFSMPAYNYLKKAGVPKYPAFFISSAIGALGIEDEKDGIKTRFTGETVFAKDIIKLKELLAILPDTPEDQIANEVIQALEYGSFGTVLPGIIDAFKFMKRYIPAMTATGTASAVMFSDNEAHGSIKNIINAVNKVPMFKSTVVDAAGKLQSSGTGEQILKTLSNQSGVKLNEIKWMNLDTYLNNRAKDIVTKEEVIDFINANKIDVSEVQFPKRNKIESAAYKEEAAVIENRRKIYEDKFKNEWKGLSFASQNYDNIYFKIAYKNQSGKKITENNSQAFNNFQESNIGRTIESFRDVDSKILDVDAIIKKYGNVETKFKTGKFSEIEFYRVIDNISNTTNTLSKRDFLDPKFNNVLKGQNSKRRYSLDNIQTFRVSELEKYSIEADSRVLKNLASEETGATKFERFTEPGGEEYTELVFKIKNKESTTPAILEGEFGTLKGNKVKATQKTSIDYRSPHFHKMNEFAHVRFKTRYLPNGKKVLTVEEMQSDLLQASKTKLFVTAQNQTGNMRVADKVLKDFPFKNTWYEFTIKRLTRYAADNGFDAIAIPKGELAANRYGQKINKLKKIEIRPMEINKGRKKGDEAGYLVALFDEKGSLYQTKSIFGVPGDDGFFEGMKKMEKDVGSNNLAEIQSLVLQADETQNKVTKVFDKAQVTGSGVGKFNLYDKTIPAYMRKYAKKWNAKVYDDQFSITTGFDEFKDMPVTVLEFSKEMRKEITTNSQPLFSFLGGVSLSTWGANEIKDNMENNIISQSTY